jgi:hypothetical protein
MTAPTSDAPITVDTGVLVSSYEEIRREIMHSAGRVRRGSGLALFVGRGMAAWLTACTPVARTLDVRKSIAADRVPADLRTEVALVLAEMALTAAHAQGASTC